MRKALEESQYKRMMGAVYLPLTSVPIEVPGYFKKKFAPPCTPVTLIMFKFVPTKKWGENHARNICHV